MGSEVSSDSDQSSSEQSGNAQSGITAQASLDGVTNSLPESLFNVPAAPLFLCQTVVKGYKELKEENQKLAASVAALHDILKSLSKTHTQEMKMLRKEMATRDRKQEQNVKMLMNKMDSFQSPDQSSRQNSHRSFKRNIYPEDSSLELDYPCQVTNLGQFSQTHISYQHQTRPKNVDTSDLSDSASDCENYKIAHNTLTDSTEIITVMKAEEESNLNLNDSENSPKVSNVEYTKQLTHDASTKKKTLCVEDTFQTAQPKTDLASQKYSNLPVADANADANKRHGNDPGEANGIGADQTDDWGDNVEDLIIQVMEATKLMCHMPDIMKDHYTELEDSERTCKKKAMQKFMEILRQAKTPGKWQQFIEASRRADYHYVVDVVTGDVFLDLDKLKAQRSMIDLVAANVKDRLKPSNITPHLVADGVINKDDSDHVQACENDKGPCQATMILLDRIFRRKQTWYDDFLKALCKIGHEDLVGEIDLDFLKVLTKQKESDDEVKDSGTDRTELDQELTTDSKALHCPSASTFSIELGDVTDGEATWAEWAKQEGHNALMASQTTGKGLNTVLLLDMSASMRGDGLSQIKAAVQCYLDGIDKVAMQSIVENVAIATFGGKTCVVQHLTCNYTAVKECLDKLQADGPSPLYAGLLMCTSALFGKSGLLVAGMLIPSRVILFSDGHVTDSSVVSGPDDPSGQNQVEVRHKVMSLTKQLCRSIKIYCVPVGDADMSLLKEIVDLGNGRILPTEDISAFALSYHAFIAAAVIAKEFSSFTKDPVYFKTLIFDKVPGVSFDDLEDVMCMIEGKAHGMINCESVENYKEINPNMPPLGTRVRRGPDWIWDNQDSDGVGTVIGQGNNGWLSICWDNEMENNYRYGFNGQFDVAVVDEPKIKGESDLISVGCLVKRDSDWHWSDQDGGMGKIGVVIQVKTDGTIMVRWPNAYCGQYRFGYDGMFDVQLCDPVNGSQEGSMACYGAASLERIDGQSVPRKVESEHFDCNIGGATSVPQQVPHVSSIPFTDNSQGRQITVDNAEQSCGDGWQWQWLHGNDTWLDFSADCNTKLEKNRSQASTVVCIEKQGYRVSYKQMVMRKIDDTTMETTQIRRMGERK